MAEPRAFISFDFDNDATTKLLFAGQAKHSKTPFSIQDWSSKSSLPQKQWENLIAEKISRTNLAIVLVGKKTSTATGVALEIAMCNDVNVPFSGVYIDGAGSTTPLPVGLPRNRVISWTWDGIAAAINQMMGERKNRITQ